MKEEPGEEEASEVKPSGVSRGWFCCFKSSMASKMYKLLLLSEAVWFQKCKSSGGYDKCRDTGS
jgi:hypothetical protein